jgi:cytochrome c-type biogenesis protein CcmH/NrfG
MATPAPGTTRGDTAVGPSTRRGRGTGLRSPSDQPPAGRSPTALSLVTLLVAALLAGLGIGRFVSARPAPVPPAPRPAAQTLSEQIAALEQRVERAPSDLAGWQRLGERYLLQGGASGDPASYGDLAERAFARAEAIAPDDPEVTLRTSVGRAMLALTRHEFDTALALGEAVLAQRPGSREALVVVVDAQVELGRYDDAAAHLQTLLDLRPALPALARASYLRELHGDIDGAVLAL